MLDWWSKLFDWIKSRPFREQIAQFIGSLAAIVVAIVVLVIVYKWISINYNFTEEHIIRFTEALAWPVIVLALIFILARPVRRFLGEAKDLTVKGGGFEMSASREYIAAAASLGAAVHNKRPVGGDSQDDITDDLQKKLPELIEKTSSPRSRKKLQQSNVLWVDDNQENNRYERLALEVLGV